MKMFKAFVLTVFLVMILFSGSAFAKEGPAPNSGDCVSDGPGWDETHWQTTGKGPAPNSGDGIPDGSGF